MARKSKSSKRTGKKSGQGAVPASSRGEQRKAKILDAATALFLKVGYGDTSIDAIVDRSGGSKATLYSFYPTKAELFRAVIDTIVSSHEGAELQSLDDVRDTLVIFAEDRLRVVFSRKHRALMRLVIAERDRFPDIARMYYERGPLRSHAQLRDYFETLIGRGLIDIRSAEEASEYFRGMLMHQRYIDQLYLDAPVPSAEEIGVRARHVVDRFLEAYHHPH
ncbi:MAG: TetR/AcrR family transcriptional regulator [Gammaproteobacteria bacterium]|nr:MAG: TetR/AcrR family transcriptional regulator [Gammaproteobacteria bacterium]